jgi:hypothetical protein
VLRASCAAAVALTVIVAGCGGESDPETPSEPPAQLLTEAFANPVTSGESVADGQVALEGVPFLSDPIEVHLDGPFEAAPDGGLPSFDLQLDGEVAGFGVDGDLVSTGDDAFVVFFGENYRVGADRVAAAEARLAQTGEGLGLDPGSWFVSPRYTGSEEVEGTDTERIEATLNSRAIASDLGDAAAALGLPPVAGAIASGIREGTAEAWVAYDDNTIRRLRTEFTFEVPPAQRQLAAGATGGTATLGLAISDPGADVEIEAPSGGGFQPIDQLINRLTELAGLAL